jgi:membrane protease subunit (stomatin/prohibitin family)
MAAHEAELARKVTAEIQPCFTALGLALHSFVIENLSLAEELQKVRDQRIGMNLAGDLGRYRQFEAVESLEAAAGNGGGSAGAGLGLAAGISMGQTIMRAMQPAIAVAGGAARFCQGCGREIPRSAGFCPECGEAQTPPQG